MHTPLLGQLCYDLVHDGYVLNTGFSGKPWLLNPNLGYTGVVKDATYRYNCNPAYLNEALELLGIDTTLHMEETKCNDIQRGQE